MERLGWWHRLSAQADDTVRYMLEMILSDACPGETSLFDQLWGSEHDEQSERC